MQHIQYVICEFIRQANWHSVVCSLVLLTMIAYGHVLNTRQIGRERRSRRTQTERMKEQNENGSVHMSTHFRARTNFEEKK